MGGKGGRNAGHIPTLRSAYLSVVASTVSRSSSCPYILFLMSDQHRGDCLRAAGNPIVHTPNLDRLAHEGALFRCAYSSIPSCTPSRAALLTGLSPWRHGMLGFGRMALQYKLEMPRLLREAGYYTVGIGKMHFYPQRNRHGFHQTILEEDEKPDFRSDYSAWFRSEAPAWASEAGEDAE
ncbi:MAG TPA: sulfatase-like hydrolase/transferase, partial [Chthonomonadales bacterium]|nr:sulfatase-like hydrolase/transferase [Chthonomonadales bacterium]